jgi:transcriptional regulator with XRE-family HTH domain
MKINEKHHRAAKLLANGSTEAKTAAAVGVSLASISRWKREDEFRALIIRYAEPLRAAVEATATPENLDLFEQIPDSESDLIAELQAIVAKLSSTVLKRLEALTDDEIEEIPTRLIPSFVKAFTDALETLQQANDRRSGYDLVVTELGKILEAKSGNRKG